MGSLADPAVVPLWINGEATTSSPPTTFTVTSVSKPQETPITAHSADSAAATRAADAAWAAFGSWKKTSPQTRRDLLLRAASAYESRMQQLIEVQVQETSCTEQLARMNVSYAIELLKETASRVTGVAGEIPQVMDHNKLALVFREPLGPVLTIAPWNGAIILSTRAICAPIVVGCTVVFKASELCPKSHHCLREAWEEAGVPKGVLNVIQTSRENAPQTTETLIAHPKIRKVEFIGSRAVGKIIGQMCAKYVKPVLMELGGKSAAIILDDANLEQAADLCLLGLSVHHGQLCFSTERLLVQDTIASKFMELLRIKAPSHSAGLPVTQAMAENADKRVLEAEEKGARFLVGSSGSDDTTGGLKTTILTGVTKDMSIFDEETFGPSASLYTFKADLEAIEMANDSEYGLTAAVHSSNMERALDIARELEVGQVHINNLTEYDEPTLPIGGEKASGWGRSNSHWGLNEYLTFKTVTISMKGGKTFM